MRQRNQYKRLEIDIKVGVAAKGKVDNVCKCGLSENRKTPLKWAASEIKWSFDRGMKTKEQRHRNKRRIFPIWTTTDEERRKKDSKRDISCRRMKVKVTRNYSEKTADQLSQNQPKTVTETNHLFSASFHTWQLPFPFNWKFVENSL